MAIIAAMATDDGLPPARVAASSLAQGALGMGVGLLVLVAAWGTALDVSAVWLVVSMAGVAAMLVTPLALRALPMSVAAIERRIPGITNITVRTMWALIWTSSASWVLWGVAPYALGRAVLSPPGMSLITGVTAWAGSFLAGLLLVIAPAGLGAREGVMQAVLARAAGK